MKFGPTPTKDAIGAILAHSTRLPGRVIKKGTLLSAEDVAQLLNADIESVTAASMEDGDVSENDAAARVTNALIGENTRTGAAFTGRCNLVSEAHGVLCFDVDKLNALNAVSESITVATLAPYEVVTPGQMIATIKIIPFAVSGAELNAALDCARAAALTIMVAPFKARKTGLILTRLPGMKESILDNTVKTANARIETYGSTIDHIIRCDHNQEAVAGAIAQLVAKECELLFIFGASAVVDRQDVLPAAVVDAGGQVVHFGMPVDPGNLLFIGSIAGRPVVGMPGCARSPKLNGFDWVLWRLLAGLQVSANEITQMGSGGLLKEISERGQKRSGEKDAPLKADGSETQISALILAAGSSRRMGAENKLLADIDGKPMVRHVTEAVAAANIRSITVVTGHEPELIEAALSGIDATFVHNPDFSIGLSTSLRVGAAAIGGDVDGVIICLGDMPMVSSADIDQLIRAFDPVEGRSICVPVAGRKRGNPVLWAHPYLAEMAEISGDVGARH
ncbi:MAG: NTP transferase domain-containing protein, partial [Rhodospirillales bacterium]|nr:NTP transferase domain-containing protein [Rhodospirillales bacterium]